MRESEKLRRDVGLFLFLLSYPELSLHKIDMLWKMPKANLASLTSVNPISLPPNSLMTGSPSYLFEERCTMHN